MSEPIFVTVNGQGGRLDRIIAEQAGVSRAMAVKIIESGGASVDGRVITDKNFRPTDGQILEFCVPEPRTADILPENIELNIVYEDENLLVVNKPKGMVVHPAAGNYTGTLVNALMYHCGESLSGINGVLRPGIVHRIDKDTSGLLLVAKDDFTHASLAEQIGAHSVKREYEGIVVGNLRDDSGTINLPIGRSPRDRKKQAVNGLNPRNAVTHFEVLCRYGSYTHCRFILETGRTHQIRVHMASKGHPLAGDTVYGGEKNKCGLDGQCLHAKTIGFLHPVTQEYMEFTSGLPEYFTEFISRLERRKTNG